MKRLLFLRTSFVVLFFLLISVGGFGQIWLNHITTGQPINSYYLGDKLPTSTYYQFEIGQATWNASEVGIGQNSDASTGWNWTTASWYADGAGSNKKVQRDITNFQFTATGTWYITGRAKINSGDAWTYSDETWNNNTSFSTITSAYYSVNALSDPTVFSATCGASSTQIDLAWTKWNSKDVIVLRNTTNSFIDPTQGTNYNVNDIIGGTATVVYKGGSASLANTSLSSGTQYYYKIYSENYSYYSAGIVVNATTRPSQPGVITGTATQCSGATSQTYSITTVTGASSYTWTLPTGWSQTAGTTTNSITVTAGSTGQNGNISVTANNTCGTSTAQTLAVTVVTTPATPGTITGTTTQCPSISSQVYSIVAVASATTYTWAVPTGWSITAGTGTNSITVTTGTAGQNGDITVTAGNTCGTSAAQTLAVTVVNTAATIASPSSASITTTTATLGGNITNIGCSSVTECGIYYSTSSGFADGTGTKVSTTGTFGVVAFTQSVTGLSAVTTYYYKAFATNSGGTVYTTEGTFTTANPIYSGKAYFNLNGGTTTFYGCNMNTTCDPGQVSDLKDGTPNVGSLSQGQNVKLGGNSIQYGSVFADATMHYRVYKSGNTAPAYSTIALANNGAPGNGCSGSDIKWEKSTTSFTPIVAGNNSAGVYEGTGTYVVDIYYTANSGAITWYKTGTTPFTANFTVTPDIFSAKVAFKIDSGTTTWHSANHNEGCDAGNAGGNFDTKDFGVVIRTGSTALAIGGNLIANTAVTAANLRYRIYLTSVSPTGLAYQTVALSSTGTTSCSATKKEENTPQTITASSFATDGEYYIEAYFEATDAAGAVIYNNSGSNFKARISIYTPTPTGDRDDNDGNYDPTATNTSGIYESYMGIKVLDENDIEIPGLNRVFDMDGALSSSNGTNFDFATQNPGLSFNVGTEAKIFTKGTHKDCGCSSWYYVYKNTDANPIATDFPLPAAGSLFTNQINGKFTMINSSEVLGANTPFVRTDTAAILNSTSITSYNNLLGPIGASTIKYKDYTDPVTGTVTSINLPVNTVGCPTCSGTYKVAIAMLAWVSTTGDCSNASSLIYHRDINRNKITDAGVVLNPNHPDTPSSGTGSPTKNTLTGTNLFYVSKVTIGAQNGLKTWNGSSWSPSGLPTVKNDVKLSSNYSTTTSGSFSCNDLTVDTGITLTVNNGNFVETLNTATTTGTAKIVVENSGNFVQRCNEKAASAKIEHTKTTSAKTKWAYEYWGSPIVQDLASSIPSAFDKSYYWDGGLSGAGWKTVQAGTIPAGKGFITRVKNIAPYNTTATAIDWMITGTANNGIYTTPVKNAPHSDPQTSSADYLDYALLANPYPCAIDATTFISHPRNLSIIKSTLYFWTSITPIVKNDYTGFDSYIYNYNPADYATWNLTGGAGTSAAATGGAIPSGKIASGQAFFVEVDQDGDAYFDNTMRLTADVNTQFFRSKPKTQNKQASRPEEGRIWLNVSNVGHFRQMLLGYVNGATNEFDKRFDGISYTDSKIDLYTMVGNKNLVIQGRQLPFDENEIVPIGYETSDAGDFYINIDNTDGFMKNQNVYLKDNLLGIEHDLKQSAYLFSTTIGRFDNRFELEYTSKTLGVKEVIQNPDKVLVSSSGNMIKVNSTSEEISSVTVYDVTGKKLFFKNNIDKTETILDKLSKQNSLLLVKVKLINGQESTKKVIF